MKDAANRSEASLSPRGKQTAWIVAVVVLLGAGCYFRLAGLDATSMHGDAQFHDFCRAGVSVSRIFAEWEQLMGPSSGQMPPAAALTRGFLEIFRLPPTRANVILPSALWGIATLPVALWVGRRFGGRTIGLLLMAVVALNPIHIQLSRTAYYYLPAIVGFFTSIWCVLESWDSVKERRQLRWSFHLANAVATVLMLYSTAGAWPYAALVSIFHVSCAAANKFMHRTGWRDLLVMGFGFLVAGIPLLMVPWGVKGMLGMTGNTDHAAYWRRIFDQGRNTPILLQGSREYARLAWGWTAERIAIGSVIFGSGIVTAVILARRDRKWILPLVLFMLSVVLAVLALKASVWPYAIRRASSTWPHFFLIIAFGLYGFWLVGQKMSRFGVLRWSGIIPSAVAFGLWIHSDMLVVKAKDLAGPQRTVSEWLDRTFQRGTPVVTDRFFARAEYLHEMPTNAVIVSTVPNEIPEIQEKTRFRQVTQQYLEENPDAVFYCAGHMYDRPEVVPWEWPTRYFMRKHEIRCESADALGVIGQNYHREYPGTARSPIVYHNTIEDVAAIKREKKEPGFVLYGPDWRPVQTQDYRLWRLLLSGDGVLKVYGLANAPQEVVLEVTAAAAGGELRFKVGEQTCVFPANQIVQQRYQVKLQPGMNDLPVRSRGAPNTHLLIAKVAVAKEPAAENGH